MIKFIVITFVAYLSIDFAVYWLGDKKNLAFTDIMLHHAKMLPIYLIANMLLTYGFNAVATKNYNPILLFGISMLIWSTCLLIVSMVLYKVYPNWLSVLGFGVILLGVVLIQYSIRV